MNHDHVLWIGGASGTGKSTLARLFARRHGLQWYSCDTRTWEHRDRALAAGDSAAHQWESLTPTERGDLAPEEQLRLSVDRTQMILDDVRRLPPEPAAVVDGTPVTPAMIEADVAAVWLIATPDSRNHRIRQRGWGAPGSEANELQARALAAATSATDRFVLDTTGRTTDQLLAALDQRFSTWLSHQPTGMSARERRRLIREGNIAIVRQYRAGLARPWATADPGSITRTYDCECAAPGCTALIQCVLSAFPIPFDEHAPPLLAEGHGGTHVP